MVFAFIPSSLLPQMFFAANRRSRLVAIFLTVPPFAPLLQWPVLSRSLPFPVLTGKTGAFFTFREQRSTAIPALLLYLLLLPFYLTNFPFPSKALSIFATSRHRQAHENFPGAHVPIPTAPSFARGFLIFSTRKIPRFLKPFAESAGSALQSENHLIPGIRAVPSANRIFWLAKSSPARHPPSFNRDSPPRNRLNRPPSHPASRRSSPDNVFRYMRACPSSASVPKRAVIGHQAAKPFAGHNPNRPTDTCAQDISFTRFPFTVVRPSGIRSRSFPT